MYIAINKTDENNFIVLDTLFEENHPVHTEYFVFNVGKITDIDSVIRAAKIRRAGILATGKDPIQKEMN